MKRTNKKAATSDEEDERDDNRLEENEIFENLSSNIDRFLHNALSEKAWSNKLGSVASAMFTSSTWIKSMSTGSKIAYENLKSTTFEDVTKTAEQICTVMGKAHWAASGLLVVAAVIHTIHKSKRVDRECLELLDLINTIAKSLKRFTHLPIIPEEMKSTVNEAREVIATSAACCLSIIHSSRFRKFFCSPRNEEQIVSCSKRLRRLQKDFSFQLTIADYSERHELRSSVKRKIVAPAGTVDPGQSHRESSPTSKPEAEQSSHDRKVFQKIDINRCIPNIKDMRKGIGIQNININGCIQKIKNICKGSDEGPPSGASSEMEESEDPVDRVKKLLELRNERVNARAVFVCGDRYTGKVELADQIYSELTHVLGNKWKQVTVKNTELESVEEGLGSQNDVITTIRREILSQLHPHPKVNAFQQDIESDQYWQKKFSEVLKDNKVFIYIDHVPSPQVLKGILPKKLGGRSQVRLLLTIRDKHVLHALDGSTFQRRQYVMKPLSYKESLQLFAKNLAKDKSDTLTVRRIVKICKGYKNRMKIVWDYLIKYYRDDEAFRRLSEWIKTKDPDFIQLKYYLNCEEKFLHLSYICKDALLDVCSFYSDWDWDEAACVLDNVILEKLRELELLKRESKRVFVPEYVMSFCLSRTRGNRITSANDLQVALAEKKFEAIQGISLIKNKFPFPISSTELDKMENLRVLALGDWTIVEGECQTKFRHLRYFQAGSKVANLPFNVTQLDNIRFFDNNTRVFMAHIPERACPRLKLLKSNGFRFEHSKYLRRLPQSCQIAELDMEDIGEDSKSLPDEFCELYALRKMTLRKCSKLSRLPKSFAKLRSLKILDLSHCAALHNLPSDFGWLSSLERVNFSYCRALEDLPESIGLLSFVCEIDLSYCKRIKKLPNSFAKLSTLRVLKFIACTNLGELPEGFEGLALNELYLEGCKRLKALPESSAGKQQLLQKRVSLSWCSSLEEIPKGFINLIKDNVECLDLVDCTALEALPDEFPIELCRLRNLNLSGCTSLLRLPKRFHQLQNLEKLNLSSCEKLEESSIRLSRLTCLKEVNLSNCVGLQGYCLTSLSKVQNLTFVDIHDSPDLVDRWSQMKRQNKICQFTTATERHVLGSRYIFRSMKSVSRIEKDLKQGAYEFFHCKWYYVDANGGPFYPSSLGDGTTLVVIFDRDYQKEELQALRKILDDLQNTSEYLQIVQSGRFVSAFEREMAGKHRVYTTDSYEAHVFFQKALATVDSFDEKIEYAMIVCDIQRSGGDLCFSSWKSITTDTVKAMTMDVPTAEFLRLKELTESPRPSNIEILRALLITNKINFLITRKNQMEVNKLEKKVVLLLLSWLHKWEEEKEIYGDVYQKLEDLCKEQPESKSKYEVVCIPIIVHGRDTRALHAKAVQEMPWASIADPWSINPPAMQLFRMHPDFNKLPLVIAVSPTGQLHFQNLIQNKTEMVTDSLNQLEKEMVRKLKEEITKKEEEMKEEKIKEIKKKQEEMASETEDGATQKNENETIKNLKQEIRNLEGKIATIEIAKKLHQFIKEFN